MLHSWQRTGELHEHQKRSLVIEQAQKGMINPFVNQQVKEQDGNKRYPTAFPAISTTYGLAVEFKVFTNVHSAVVDPKKFDKRSFVEMESDICIIPPIALRSVAPSSTSRFLAIPC